MRKHNAKDDYNCIYKSNIDFRDGCSIAIITVAFTSCIRASKFKGIARVRCRTKYHRKSYSESIFSTSSCNAGWGNCFPAKCRLVIAFCLQSQCISVFIVKFFWQVAMAVKSFRCNNIENNQKLKANRILP